MFRKKKETTLKYFYLIRSKTLGKNTKNLGSLGSPWITFFFVFCFFLNKYRAGWKGERTVGHSITRRFSPPFVDHLDHPLCGGWGGTLGSQGLWRNSPSVKKDVPKHPVFLRSHQRKMRVSKKEWLLNTKLFLPVRLHQKHIFKTVIIPLTSTQKKTSVIVTGNYFHPDPP